MIVCKGCGAELAPTGRAGRPREYCPGCQSVREQRNRQRRRFVRGLGYCSLVELADDVAARPDVVFLLRGK
jgi:hypothetical protein